MSCKLVSKEISLATIIAMTPEDQNVMARKFVKANAGIKEDKTTLRETAKVIGKFLCALEIRLNAGIAARAFPANHSLAELFKDITGEKPQTHVLTLKNAYGAFVETKFMTENDYDVNSGNCLELAAQIVKAVNGDLTHAAIPQAVEQLKERGNTAPKKLREILASVKPAAPMTPDEALEMYQEIASAGQLAVVLVETPDLVTKMKDEDQRSIYLAFMTAMERFDKAIGGKIDQWVAEKTAAEAPVKHVGSPLAETPELAPA